MDIPFEQSPNFTATKTKKIGFVFHGTLGGFSGAKETLKAAVRKDSKGRDIGRASAHLLIGREKGKIVELVKPEQIAWHAGVISNPKKNFTDIALKNPDGSFVNPNMYLIGIEFCWGYDADGDKVIEPEEFRCVDWQLEAFHEYEKKLQAMGIATVRLGNIITHSDLTDYKTDNLSKDIERYYALYHPELLHTGTKPAICTVPTLPTVTQELVYGSKGSEVLLVQKILRKLGFFKYPTDTGNLYEVTQKAIVDFQSHYSLPVTGNVDAPTRNVLNSLACVAV